MKKRVTKARNTKVERKRNALEILYVVAVALSLLVVGLSAVNGYSATTDSKEATRPKNLVLIPDYGPAAPKEHPDESSDEKLQYEPVTKDDSIIEERDSPEEVTRGAKYKPSKELYVAPVSAHVRKDEAIEEAPAEQPSVDGPYPVEVVR